MSSQVGEPPKPFPPGVKEAAEEATKVIPDDQKAAIEAAVARGDIQPTEPAPAAPAS
jgi:hypothetical protein